jgi:Na+/H+-translocating membrane pyrophosphatase
MSYGVQPGGKPLFVAGYLVRDVWRQESSTAQMEAVADAIREGAKAEH